MRLYLSWYYEALLTCVYLSGYYEALHIVYTHPGSGIIFLLPTVIPEACLLKLVKHFSKTTGGLTSKRASIRISAAPSGRAECFLRNTCDAKPWYSQLLWQPQQLSARPPFTAHLHTWALLDIVCTFTQSTHHSITHYHYNLLSDSLRVE